MEQIFLIYFCFEKLQNKINKKEHQKLLNKIVCFDERSGIRTSKNSFNFGGCPSSLFVIAEQFEETSLDKDE